MQVTVAICTWNRAKLLDQTLAQLGKLRIPDGVEWELLVVDNSSTDDTDSVLSKHVDKLPLRRLFEPKQGHSHARNCAIEVARGELLLWTDDDVLVESDWLSAYVKAAAKWPEAEYFGGPIEPWFETEPPRWLQKHFARVQGAYAVRDYGEKSREFTAKEYPLGANMAFRTETLRRYPFRTDLGRRGNSLVSGDEVDVLQRMRADGRIGMWVNDARVKHFIPKQRLNADFLWRLNYGGGKSYVRMKGRRDVPMIAGAPRWAVVSYWKNRLGSWLLSPLKSERWIETFVRSAQLRGMIDESRANSEAHRGDAAISFSENSMAAEVNS